METETKTFLLWWQFPIRIWAYFMIYVWEGFLFQLIWIKLQTKAARMQTRYLKFRLWLLEHIAR